MRPPALTRKLLRDLWNLRAQALAIAAVIASGVAMWVIAYSTIASLEATQRAFYDDYRFADVFAQVTRAPDSVAERVRALDGVARVSARISGQATLDLAEFDQPVTARLVSLPDTGEPALNRLYLRSGRLPAPGSSHEALISEPFAQAHGIGPGARIDATIHGSRETLTVVGVALSPEFVYQIQPGALFPDYERYAIAWMREPALGAAFDMNGAFNDLALGLEPGVQPERVVPSLDALLARYGGTGAHDRTDQASHRYLSQELDQLRSMASVVPLLFLGVSAFLVSIVTSRTVHQQRGQIAVLKAFGYGDGAIGRHYLMLVTLMVLAGALPGLALGAWGGHGMASLYRDFFRFPFLAYQLPLGVALGGVALALLAALGGALRAVLRAVRLPPAEAMRPEPPARYRTTLVERLGLQRWLDQPSRMILRHIERRPANAGFSVLGIALAGAILTVGSFQEDAIDYVLDVHFKLAGREDATITFTERTDLRALDEIRTLDGVRAAEPFRSVAVELVSGPRRHRSSIQGRPREASLNRALDQDRQPITLPRSGLLLSRWIAQELGVRTGDTVKLRLLDGSGNTPRVKVAGLVEDFIGASGYMRIDALNRLVGEGRVASGAYLAIAEPQRAALFSALERRPRVAAISQRTAAMDAFLDTMGDTLLIFAFVNTLLAGSIAVGVIYNAARLAYAERSRELGSLRILGFTRAETAYILLGELALLTLLAIPLAFALGWGFCALIASGLESELLRMPLVIETRTLGTAALIILAAALASGAAVARRLYRMDLAEILKVRE